MNFFTGPTRLGQFSTQSDASDVGRASENVAVSQLLKGFAQQASILDHLIELKSSNAYPALEFYNNMAKGYHLFLVYDNLETGLRQSQRFFTDYMPALRSTVWHHIPKLHQAFDRIRVSLIQDELFDILVHLRDSFTQLSLPKDLKIEEIINLIEIIELAQRVCRGEITSLFDMLECCYELSFKIESAVKHLDGFSTLLLSHQKLQQYTQKLYQKLYRLLGLEVPNLLELDNSKPLVLGGRKSFAALFDKWTNNLKLMNKYMEKDVAFNGPRVVIISCWNLYMVLSTISESMMKGVGTSLHALYAFKALTQSLQVLAQALCRAELKAEFDVEVLGTLSQAMNCLLTCVPYIYDVHNTLEFWPDLKNELKRFEATLNTKLNRVSPLIDSLRLTQVGRVLTWSPAISKPALRPSMTRGRKFIPKVSQPVPIELVHLMKRKALRFRTL